MSLIVCVDNFVVFSGQDVETLWICFCKGAWQRSKRRGVSFFARHFCNLANPKCVGLSTKNSQLATKPTNLPPKKISTFGPFQRVTAFWCNFSIFPKTRKKFCEKTFLIRAVLLFCLRWKGGKTFSLRRSHFFCQSKRLLPCLPTFSNYIIPRFNTNCNIMPKDNKILVVR